MGRYIKSFFKFVAMVVISPFFTFPPVSWWLQAAAAGNVLFDGREYFQKMTNRNRYHISGANNPILLSVPLVKGRDQHSSIKEVRIFNEAQWQVQHWRTLVSVYRRAPYFDHYEESLKPLFESQYTYLIDFNRAGIDWVKRQLKINIGTMQEVSTYIKQYPPDVLDLRRGNNYDPAGQILRYHQVFEDRIGFLPDLSILDLLFAEGPLSLKYLQK